MLSMLQFQILEPNSSTTLYTLQYLPSVCFFQPLKLLQIMVFWMPFRTFYYLPILAQQFLRVARNTVVICFFKALLLLSPRCDSTLSDFSAAFYTITDHSRIFSILVFLYRCLEITRTFFSQKPWFVYFNKLPVLYMIFRVSVCQVTLKHLQWFYRYCYVFNCLIYLYT